MEKGIRLRSAEEWAKEAMLPRTQPSGRLMLIRAIQINALEVAAEVVNKQLGPFSSELNWQVQQAILAEVAKLKGEK